MALDSTVAGCAGVHQLRMTVSEFKAVCARLAREPLTVSRSMSRSNLCWLCGEATGHEPSVLPSLQTAFCTLLQVNKSLTQACANLQPDLRAVSGSAKYEKINNNMSIL